MTDQNFTKWLQSRTGGLLPHNPKRLQAVQQGENPIGLTHYPPLNTDPRFMTGNYKLLTVKYGITPKALPEEWNNYTGNEWKYKNTVKPINQGACGSCFACSVATAITDSFVFTWGFKPDISPMYILACQTNNSKCGGGNPSVVLQQIAENGVASDHCVDYFSMCENDQYCSGKKRITDDSAPNEMIPTTCGCCDNEIQHYKYYVEENPTIAYETSAIDSNGLNGGVQLIKEHIYEYGTAVAGFLVLSNFMNDASTIPGTFELTGGVFIESENYSGKTQNSNEITGGHAVCVVGWGVAQNITLPSNKTTYDRVPYWLVRNSWGPKYGFDGYFKYAMYQPAKKWKTSNK